MIDTGAPLYLGAELRAVEQRHAAAGLMQKAGLALADLAQELVGNSPHGILVVAGPGNNGGDALVAARHLRARWHRVVVVLAADPDRLPADAAAAHADWLTVGGSFEQEIPAHTHFSLVIDGLFGIGLQRPLQGEHAAIVQRINRLGCPVLAVDIPSGLHADSGRVLGCAVCATHTLTFLGNKPGLYTLDGPDHAGMVHCSDLGVAPDAGESATGHLLQTPTLDALPARPRNSHKGMYGNVAVRGGEAGMTGAVLLAARAALLCGGGRVYGGFLGTPLAVDPQQPELMLRSAAEISALERIDCAVAGPGLGLSPAARDLVQHWLARTSPLLLDADALNLLATHTSLQQAARERQAPTVITPHPLEAARLLGCSIETVQQDRIASALQLADRFNAVCALKGAGTVCATADGRWWINTSGNPGLASAGTGDVLSGIIGSLLAQRLDAASATVTGVYLHGAAADRLVQEGTGPVGLCASELAPAARHLINQHQQAH
jgi:hydroxyethylthiazole kinase-like uncharacterized protein yjeF